MGTIDVLLQFKTELGSLNKTLSGLSKSLDSAINNGAEKGAVKAGKVLENGFVGSMKKAFSTVGRTWDNTWDGIRKTVSDNPIMSITLGAGLFSFISGVWEDFKKLDNESARLGAIFNQTKGEIIGLADTLYQSNLAVSVEEITQTMGAFAQEGLTLDKKLLPAMDAVVAFKGLIGEAADAVIPMIASFEKTGRGATNIGLMLGAAVNEWGNTAPKAIAAMSKYARATGTSGNKIADGFNKIGGTLKKLGATSEEAQDFMEMLYDQDYRKMPPMFQAFAHLRKDGAAFANAIKPAMSQMQNILRGVPDHLVPQMAESLGISTEIANAMRGGLDYEAAVKQQEAKKAAVDIKKKRAEQQATIDMQAEAFKRGMTSAIREVIGQNYDSIKEIMGNLMTSAKVIADLFLGIFADPEGDGNWLVEMIKLFTKPEMMASLAAIYGLFKMATGASALASIMKGTGLITGAGALTKAAGLLSGAGAAVAAGFASYEATKAFLNSELFADIFGTEFQTWLTGGGIGDALFESVKWVGEKFDKYITNPLNKMKGIKTDEQARLDELQKQAKDRWTDAAKGKAVVSSEITKAATEAGKKIEGGTVTKAPTTQAPTTKPSTTPTAPKVSAANTLSFDANKKASDNQLLMDIRTILAASLDVERGQLGAIIDQRSIERSKLLLQELDTMRGK